MSTYVSVGVRYSGRTSRCRRLPLIEQPVVEPVETWISTSSITGSTISITGSAGSITGGVPD